MGGSTRGTNAINSGVPVGIKKQNGREDDGNSEGEYEADEKVQRSGMATMPEESSRTYKI